MGALDHEPWARQVYDDFLITHPDVPVVGLFVQADRYFIVSPLAHEKLADGSTRSAKFARQGRPAASPIDLVLQVPPGSQPVAARTRTEVADAFGTAYTEGDIVRQVSARLPQSFPLGSVSVDGTVLVVHVTQPLTMSERATLTQVVMNVGQPLSLDVRPASTTPERGVARPPKGSLELVPSRQWRNLPDNVRGFLEDDEDFWRSEYRRAWPGEMTVDEILGAGRTRPENSCFVGTMFPPGNVRTYLSLYDHVVLTMPLVDGVDEMLRGLAISRHELLGLVARGTVSFVVPQSTERYQLDLLREILEARPAAVLGSRRLAAAAHVDQMDRNPLFVFPGTGVERRTVLRALRRLGEEIPAFGAVIGAAVAGLSESWASYERLLHVRGAMVSVTGPLATVAQQLAKLRTGDDHFLEIGAAAQHVEWASALGAHLAPFESEDYSEVSSTELLLALHAGTSRGRTPLATATEFSVAKGLLVIDNQVDITDFVTELGQGDLARFRRAVRGIARPGRSDAEIAEVVANWNGQVRKYERKPDRMKSMGLGGLVLGPLAKAIGAPDLVSVSAALMPFLPAALTYLQESFVGEHRDAGSLVDFMNARLAGVHRDAPLLARMRKLVKGMK